MKIEKFKIGEIYWAKGQINPEKRRLAMVFERSGKTVHAVFVEGVGRGKVDTIGDHECCQLAASDDTYWISAGMKISPESLEVVAVLEDRAISEAAKMI